MPAYDCSPSYSGGWGRMYLLKRSKYMRYMPVVKCQLSEQTSKRNRHLPQWLWCKSLPVYDNRLGFWTGLIEWLQPKRAPVSIWGTSTAHPGSWDGVRSYWILPTLCVEGNMKSHSPEEGQKGLCVNKNWVGSGNSGCLHPYKKG